MGKNQHSKDRLYITANEYRKELGGRPAAATESVHRLPFDCCALSFVPFTDPVCTQEGHVFELSNIHAYLKKHHVNPVTGTKLSAKDLVPLHYHRNPDGKYHCPVMFKVFNENTTIVAIRPSGNVYCYEAVKELNVKAKNWTDLISGEPFAQKDIITLQDPKVVKDTDKFFHVGQAKSVESEPHIQVNHATKLILDKIKEVQAAKYDFNQEKSEVIEDDQLDRIARKLCRSTTAECSGALTSTGMAPVAENVRGKASMKEVNEYRWRAMRSLRQQGYVRMVTNLGDLNLEVFCGLAPQTAENFMTLCARGYYDNTMFHRLIPGFMVQGGDPTGTGSGGESIWGGSFSDEFHTKLTHDHRGVLSMSNCGPNTNKSQFFITFQACTHLDHKHSIFGQLVGGIETLRAIEAIPTDSKNRPQQPVLIQRTIVFVNPFDKLNDVVEEQLNKMFPDSEEPGAEKRSAPGPAGGAAKTRKLA